MFRCLDKQSHHAERSLYARQSLQVAGQVGRWAGGMRSADVEYSPVGEGLGMREFWLYVWLRRVAVIAAHVTGMGLTLIISLLSRPGTSE